MSVLENGPEDRGTNRMPRKWPPQNLIRRRHPEAPVLERAGPSMLFCPPQGSGNTEVRTAGPGSTTMTEER